MDIFGMDSDCAGAVLDGAIQSRYEYTWADGGRAVPGVRRFSIYAERQSRQLYLFYTKHTIRAESSNVVADQIYLARCAFDELESLSAWRKYTGSGFTEPGNCGRDTAIVGGGAIASVCRDETGKRYIMSTYNREAWQMVFVHVRSASAMTFFTGHHRNGYLQNALTYRILI